MFGWGIVPATTNIDVVGGGAFWVNGWDHHDDDAFTNQAYMLICVGSHSKAQCLMQFAFGTNTKAIKFRSRGGVTENWGAWTTY